MPACSGSTAATSSMSGAAPTAAHTVEPIRPPAPNTPTRIMREPVTAYRRQNSSAECGPTTASVRDAPAKTRSITRSMSSAVTASTRAIRLIERRDLALDQLRSPDAAHPARRRLERHRQRADEVALGARDLDVGETLRRRAGRARRRSPRASRARARARCPRRPRAMPASSKLDVVREDRVREPARTRGSPGTAATTCRRRATWFNTVRA